ncbi:GNAT family N-acetyltransferase [Vibrio vulnificus]|uniref:Histone acetyltransferase HPA2 n=1 Tax=Vibrio vulnificus TaxID=672 RepID=A0AAN1PTL1_VIBVL|nr:MULTISPECIES: GNAT family N-acetyltransferase [Vibrio]ADV89358.1 histone acetyltransferase HPA2 [Vibrio vulnificus MO6-24/O]ANN29415.1 Histone acetyltransferase HPA2 [Vibrio vulnificus]ARN68826.1 Histone acetyltransferase HPA2 [Vibrio vulnificus]AXX62684.1 Histone acetyltransferase HPA2 [Vibrio vulnificus]EGQ8090756.1 GNAT family N-acetyltransferase [Vibrio vulnificus]
MIITTDNLQHKQVITLLEEHLQDMYATSPAESVHALDLSALQHPDVTFWTGWQKETLLGCTALKRLTHQHGELKSMRTTHAARGKGVASTLLQHLIEHARQQGYQQISLETGTMAFFAPARALYEKFGFEYCAPFGDYQEDPNSCFMTLTL